MPGADSAGGKGDVACPVRLGRAARSPALLELLSGVSEQLGVIVVGPHDCIQALVEACSPCSVGECGGSGLRLAPFLLPWTRSLRGRLGRTALTVLVPPGLAARRCFALEDVVVQRL